MTMKEKEPDNKGHDVFISYATEKGDSTVSDLPIAEKICSALESKGISCWMAPRDVLPGDEDVKAMIEAVMHSKVVVLIFSSNTDKSHWVKSEVRKALDEKITIIPFCIENGFDQSILGFMVGSRHRINANTQPLGKHLDKLVEAVRKHLGKEQGKGFKGMGKNPEAVQEGLWKEERKGFFQKKWILLAASIIVLVAIVYIFRYQPGIVPEEKSPVKKTGDRSKKDEPVKKTQKEPTKKKPVTRKREAKQEREEGMPKDVRIVESKGIKVEKNKRGFWEAHLRDGIVMVYILPGEFTRGSNDGEPDEEPAYKIYLDGYWMGKSEVTNAQYVEFLNDSGIDHKDGCQGKQCISTYEEDKDSHIKGSKNNYHVGLGYEKHPIIEVSWYGAVEYCEWLSKKHELKFKLPTEAQWEKAARGNDGRKYPWGNHAPFYKGKWYANYAAHDSWVIKGEDGFQYTAPVNSYPQGASAFGLLDMAGNVWEWCNDWYNKCYYLSALKKNPIGPRNGSYRVIRGGGCYSAAMYIRCADRSNGRPSQCSYDVGFRLCQGKD